MTFFRDGSLKSGQMQIYVIFTPRSCFYRKTSVMSSKYNLFESTDPDLTAELMTTYLNEGQLYIAQHACLHSQYDDALTILNQLKTAEASFESAIVRTCTVLLMIHTFVSCLVFFVSLIVLSWYQVEIFTDLLPIMT